MADIQTEHMLMMQVLTTMAETSGRSLLEEMTPGRFHDLSRQGPKNLDLFRRAAANSLFCDRLRLAVDSVNAYLGKKPTNLLINQWRAVLQPLADGGTFLRPFDENTIRVGYTDFFWAP